MKVKVIDKAFYGGRIVNDGEIIEIEAKIVPSWAVKIEDKKGNKPKDNNKAQDKNNENSEVDEVIAKASQDAIKGLSEDEKKEYLGILIDEANQKGIIFEDDEEKTTEEKIFELNEILKGN